MWQPLWFATLLVYAAFSAEIADNKTKGIIVALNKLLDFTQKHPEELNFDAVLGLSFAEAQLNSAIDLNENQTIKDVLRDLTVKSKISRLLFTHSLIRDSSAKNSLQVLLNPAFWEKQIIFKDGNFPASNGNKWHENNYRLFLEGISELNDHLFDACLMELLQSDGCFASSFCKELIIDDHYLLNQFGYALTHRLLYLHISLRIGQNCRWNVERKVWEICSKIYSEVTFIERLGFPTAFNDLLMEELFLCGLSGYTEFLGDNFLSTVLKSQTEEGCYFVPTTSLSRAKKNSNLMHSAKCIDHTTGLAAALLALLLRYNLDLELINNSPE